MKVRLTLDVDDHERYVIAKYYRGDGKPRTRATRGQVERFARAALRRVVKDLVEEMDGRGKAAARRLLQSSDDSAVEVVPPAREHQRDLPLTPETP